MNTPDPEKPWTDDGSICSDEEALMHAIVLLRSWHEDGTAWSEWDTYVERNLVAFQKRFTTRTALLSRLLFAARQLSKEPDAYNKINALIEQEL